MRILLDTHTLLWWINNDSQLSKKAQTLIGDVSNEILVSAVSGWEIAIKAQIGKVTVAANLEQFVTEQVTRNYFTLLPIKLSHALHIYSLPLHHRDPFDRMLIVQSQLEQIPILTVDSLLTQYDVETIW
jgi:PIN domain nuclease of toxin-antitoxin system